MTAAQLAGLRRILVVKLSALGDIVHVTPCLRALRRACPQAQIAMAVDRRFAGLVRESPEVDEIIEGEEGRSRGAAWTEPWRRLAGHWAPRFDLAIDFQGTRRSALWTYASGARCWAGFVRRDAGRGWRPGWRHVARPDPARHAVRVCAAVAEAVGVSVHDLSPRLVVAGEADRRCAARLERLGAAPRGFILVNPFTRWASKTWPLDRYRALVDRLAAERATPIVVHAGPGEEAGLAAFRPPAPDPGLAVVGGLPLEEALALFARARLMVTGDTGPMHCAAALGVPVVALFGPTWPERTGPWGTGHRIVQAERPPTHHAFRTDVAGRYIRAIDVEAVFRAVRAALAAGETPRQPATRGAPGPNGATDGSPP